MSENFSKKDEDIEASKAPLISHLIELRDRLKWAVLFFFSSFLLLLLFCKCYLRFFSRSSLQNIFKNGVENPRMIYTALTEAFFTYLKVSFYGALFISFPILAMQIYKFAAPGLYKNEKSFFALF